MDTMVSLDKAGRLVLPKSVREALRVGPGDQFALHCENDHVSLSPIRARAGLQKEQGVWVFRSGKPVNTSIPDLLDQERDARIRELIGH